MQGGERQAKPESPGGPEILSERGVEVLRPVAAGLPNRDVGDRLFTSEESVKKHMCIV